MFLLRNTNPTRTPSRAGLFLCRLQSGCRGEGGQSIFGRRKINPHKRTRLKPGSPISGTFRLSLINFDSHERSSIPSVKFMLLGPELLSLLSMCSRLDLMQTPPKHVRSASHVAQNARVLETPNDAEACRVSSSMTHRLSKRSSPNAALDASKSGIHSVAKSPIKHCFRESDVSSICNHSTDNFSKLVNQLCPHVDIGLV